MTNKSLDALVPGKLYKTRRYAEFYIEVKQPNHYFLQPSWTELLSYDSGDILILLRIEDRIRDSVSCSREYTFYDPKKNMNVYYPTIYYHYDHNAAIQCLLDSLEEMC
jgi:hypothetical protein